MNIETGTSGASGLLHVEVKGLDVLMSSLKNANSDLYKAMRKGLREVAKDPVLSDAKSNASRIADDGTYESSLSVSSRANGSKWLLKSTDEAAPVKEYAHTGARTSYFYSRNGKTYYRKNVRVGVPKRANAPRVMVPAVNDNVDEIKSKIDLLLEAELEEVANG